MPQDLEFDRCLEAGYLLDKTIRSLIFQSPGHSGVLNLPKKNVFANLLSASRMVGLAEMVFRGAEQGRRLNLTKLDAGRRTGWMIRNSRPENSAGGSSLGTTHVTRRKHNETLHRRPAFASWHHRCGYGERFRLGQTVECQWC